MPVVPVRVFGQILQILKASGELEAFLASLFGRCEKHVKFLFLGGWRTESKHMPGPDAQGVKRTVFVSGGSDGRGKLVLPGRSLPWATGNHHVCRLPAISIQGFVRGTYTHDSHDGYGSQW